MSSSSLRVAVTGGSGKVGHFVIKELLSRGHSVVNLDRRQAREPLCRYVYIDLAHREILQPVLEQVDAVCHLGEIPTSNHPIAGNDIFATNTAIGSCVLQTSADLKLKRVIYTSTCQTYGSWDRGSIPPVFLPMDETHPLRPRNVYALSKVANESYAHYVSREFGLPVAIFRFPWVVTHPINERMATWIKSDAGPADGMETYVGAEDAARAYAMALETIRPGCEAYHFSAPDVLSGVPIRKRLLEQNPDYPPLPEDWPDFKSPLLTGKAKDHFGWEPGKSMLDPSR